MSEKIDLVSHATASIMLMNAVAKHFPRSDLRAALSMERGGSTVEVKLTVNGVEIPFKSTIEDMWKQMVDSRDERALELAKDIITGAGLQNIFEAVRDAEWHISNALNEALEKMNDVPL